MAEKEQHDRQGVSFLELREQAVKELVGLLTQRGMRAEALVRRNDSYTPDRTWGIEVAGRTIKAKYHKGEDGAEICLFQHHPSETLVRDEPPPSAARFGTSNDLPGVADTIEEWLNEQENRHVHVVHEPGRPDTASG